MMLEVKYWTIEMFTEICERVQGFAFARFSDGGFFCMRGDRGENCDGVIYTQHQADCLLAVLQDSTIFHGITGIAMHYAEPEKVLDRYRLCPVWYDADVMLKASDDGKLWPFIEFLQRKRVLLVGPKHLERLKIFKGSMGFIEVHPTEAFEYVNHTELQVERMVRALDPQVILLSCGQGAAPTLVSRLHKTYPQVTVVDTGSLWDMYVGVLSRSGPKRMGPEKIKELGRINLCQEIEPWWRQVSI